MQSAIIRRNRKSRKLRVAAYTKNWPLYLMILPSLAYIIIFNYIPLYGLTIAFKDYNSWLGIAGSPWVGFKHFVNFLTAPNFWQLIKNTLILSLYSLAVGFPLPIILALVINEIRSHTVKRITQTISYAPYFISTVVVVGICFSVLGLDSGIINTVIRRFGGKPFSFMSSAGAFSTIYVLSGVWQSVGWGAIIYISTLSGVDGELHEAAILDGASRMQRIWHINLPAIKPVISISLLMSLGGIMGIGFEKVYLMQTDGNLAASEIIATYVYRVTLASNRPQYSFGTAVGLFNSVINLALLGVANFLAKRLGQESLW